MTDSNEPEASDPIPDEVDKGLALAYGGDSTPAPSPSVLKRIADLTGSEPKIALREEDSADETPTMKPRASDDQPEAGKYVVQGELGRGGVGAVHRGHDQDLGRDVAIKFLHEKYQSEPTVLHRFVEEAQIGGQLQHPGIVPVYDLGMVDGKPFFAMKLVKGVTLAKKLSDRDSVASDRRTLLPIFEDVCQTMAYAHARGVVHRDLKPANIMIGSFGEVQVVDWGMGKVMQSGGVADEKRAFERQAELSVIETARSAGHGTQSVMGSVMGTPAYMPPEQACGDVDAMDERSDVFALGAILCEILTGQPPYVGAGVRQLLVMAESANLDGAHARLAASGADADLVELTTQCLMPAPADRPHSAAEVAKAVHAHLASAEARAHDATVRALALKRTQKLGISLTVVITLGLAVSLWFWSDANAQRSFAVEAAENERQAAAGEKEARELADASTELARTNLASFNRVSYIARLETVKAQGERTTYPAWPNKADTIQEWLTGDAKALQEARSELRDRLTELRARALPLRGADPAAIMQTHPRFAELESKRARLAASQAAQAVRSGAEPAEDVELELSELPSDSHKLMQLAWPLVTPDRTVFGSEAKGLALLRRAMDVAPASGEGRAEVAVALGWALYTNGLDDDARTQSKTAYAAIAGIQNCLYEDSLMILESALDAAKSPESDAAIERLEAEIALLQTEVEQRGAWTFADPADQFLHDTLHNLVADLDAFAATEVAAAKQRLEWAERVEQLTITDHSARWRKARLAIVRADGVTASELYAKDLIELQPQVGLIPIGMNPATLLWEFYHLRSAWDGTSDPTTIEIPTHGPDGEITWQNGTGVKGDTGIVFVLLPGGTFTMGAQKDEPTAPNFDPAARPMEHLHDVTLPPFFLARHEMTKAQWARLWSGDESLRHPCEYPAGPARGRQYITPANPVEKVSWSMSNELLLRHGLTLPTEAQWEYGARAGTTTPFVCDLAALKDYANVSDASVTKSGYVWGKPAPWDDGHVLPAPVGSFAANAFGLHDVHGNVGEWCLGGPAPSLNWTRGGGCAAPLIALRVSTRSASAGRDPGTSLRAARTVRVPD